MASHLQTLLGAGYTLNFGTTSGDQTHQKVALALNIPDTASVQAVLADLRQKVADYLKIDIARLRIELNVATTTAKRSVEGVYDATMTIQNSNNAMAKGLSFALLIVLLVVFL